MQVAYIYCITNTVNQKKYIGKTTKRDPRTRWKQHLQAARFKDTAVAYSTANSMPIVRAIRKYGEDKFNFKVIEECTEHVVNEREEYYIKEYNTADGSGYNCTYGGEGVSKPKKYWSNHPHSKAVSCYTLDGKWERDFESMGLGAAYALNRKPTGSDHNCIRTCINGGTFQAHGYRWALKGEQPKDIEKRVNRRGKVYGIHLESNRKKMWKSQADAAEEIQGNRKMNNSLMKAIARNDKEDTTKAQVKGWYLFRNKNIALGEWKKAERPAFSTTTASLAGKAANMNTRRPIYGVHITTGEEVYFDSLTEGSFFIKGENNYTATGNIWRNIKRLTDGNESSHAHGYKWYYVDS